jgi:hypothetical protein
MKNFGLSEISVRMLLCLPQTQHDLTILQSSDDGVWHLNSLNTCIWSFSIPCSKI